jgi:hypothetical protein
MILGGMSVKIFLKNHQKTEKITVLGQNKMFDALRHIPTWVWCGYGGLWTLDLYPYPWIPILLTPGGTAYPCHALDLKTLTPESKGFQDA